MSIKLMTIVWELDLPPGEKLVLLALADQANDAGTNCWPSVATIAKRSGQSERTVQRAIISLGGQGHLTQNQRAGTSATYHVHPRHSVTPDNVSPVTNRASTPDTVSPKPSRTINTSGAKAPSVARATAKLRYHRLPEGWEPTRSLPPKLQTKVDQWPPGMLDDQLAAFRRWATNAKDEDGKGRKLDWDAAWHNWIDRHDAERPRQSHSQQAGFGRNRAAAAPLRAILADKRSQSAFGTG